MGSISFDDYFGSRVAECYTELDPMMCPPPDPRFKVHPGGVGVALIEAMRKYANNISQIEAETGNSMTHGEVLLQSIRVAQEIQRRGVTSNDIVSFCTGNHLHSCLPYLACLYLGVRVSSLDPTLSLGDAKYLLKIVNPRMVFCVSECEELMEQALAEENITADIVVFGNTVRNVPFQEFLTQTDTEHNFEAVTPNSLFDTAAIFYSSGTTGLPKGICLTHYGLLLQNCIISLNMDISRSLFFTTLYWISGVMLLVASIMNGKIRVLTKRFDEKTAMKFVEKYKVTFSFLAPTLTHRLTKCPGSCNFDTSSLKNLIVGGGPVGEKQMTALRTLLPHTTVALMYGMTEFSGFATLFNIEADVDYINTKHGSSGRAISGFCYKQVLGPNQRGELLVKSKAVMAGYHNNPEQSKKAWDSEGYLHTGDIAYYDEDYCFYIVDRIKDMLKYQSWHVAPAEIESVIMTHPQVGAAVVIGIPDEIDGDLPMGVAVRKPGSIVSENELESFVNERLPERKQLKAGIKFVDSIPLTPSGKLRRRDVRDWVLSKKI